MVMVMCFCIFWQTVARVGIGGDIDAAERGELEHERPVDRERDRSIENGADAIGLFTDHIGQIITARVGRRRLFPLSERHARREEEENRAAIGGDGW